jgi:hypothetical protein
MKQENPLIRIPTEPTQLTVFVLLNLLGFFLGIALGLWIGGRYYGVPGVVIGCVVGGIVGLIVGHLPEHLAYEWMFRSMRRKSNAELKAMIESGEWTFIQTLALLNLQIRGEDVQPYLPRVVALLEAEDRRTRLFGRDALRLVFTELALRIDDYDPDGTTEACRRKAASLHPTP